MVTIDSIRILWYCHIKQALQMVTSNNKRPFDDISAQESRVLLEIISSVKAPLLRIYDIGVEAKCSHYKHLVRLCEYVCLSPDGEQMHFPFDKQKTEKTKRTFAQSNLTVEMKQEIKDLWVGLEKLLDEYTKEVHDNKAATRHEQFVFDFLMDLVTQFAGGANIETFHLEKKSLFDCYNAFIVESKTINSTTSQKEKGELIAKARQFNFPVAGS